MKASSTDFNFEKGGQDAGTWKAGVSLLLPFFGVLIPADRETERLWHFIREGLFTGAGVDSGLPLARRILKLLRNEDGRDTRPLVPSDVSQRELWLVPAASEPSSELS